jgi:catechol 2,3-dioxygenase-like lactoylglutathione lyase family enzyme
MVPALSDPRTTLPAEVEKMIIGAHSIIYAEDAEATRAFFRDVLEFPYVDAHDGWLIFRLPPGELGIHPASGPEMPEAGSAGRHELYLMCDDIQATVEHLTGKGVEFTSPVTDRGFGLLTSMKIPGGGELGLYEPRHPLAIGLDQEQS